MRLENLEHRSKTVAVCVKTRDPLTEGSDSIFVTDKQTGLIPIVSEIMERYSRPVGLVDVSTGKRILSNDRGYQKGRVSYSATDSLFGMENGDIRVNEELLFLNFTDLPISISLPKGNRRVISPLSPESSFFKEHRGSVVIIEVMTVMNPIYKNDASGSGYVAMAIMESLKEKSAGYDSEALRSLSLMAMSTSRAIRSEKFKDVCKDSPTLQIVNSLTLNNQQLDIMRDGVVLNIREHGIMMSCGELAKLPISERLKLSKSISEEDLLAINNTCMVAYIVNKNSEIGPRFASSAGVVHEITQITDTEEEDGLYVIVKVGGRTEHEDYYSFEDMDKSPYIFKDMETAKRGMDTRMLATERLAELERSNKLKDQELKTYELELKKERATKEEAFKEWEREWEIDKRTRIAELEEEKRKRDEEYDKKRKEREDVMDKKKRKRERRAEKEARAASRESEKLRLEMERMDHQHKVELASLRYSTEHMKSGSEETQLSLKTIGAALALGSVAFLAFKKL